MYNVILVRYGEIMLKGLNRNLFEKKLMDNIRLVLRGLGPMEIQRTQGRIFVRPHVPDYPMEEAMERMTNIFGIVSVSPAIEIEGDFTLIKDTSVKYLTSRKEKTFKVAARRANKSFPLETPRINAALGAHILEYVPGFTVDVLNPQITLYVEVRNKTYIYSEILPSKGGLPVGSNGKATLLISGGIDSPVAGWMMGKRGLEVNAVHFYSYPYTGERSKEKVLELVRRLSVYLMKVDLYIVPFTAIQEEIVSKCDHSKITIIMRRIMMRIGEIIAGRTNSKALITGESLGQVASQTLESLACTNRSVSLPVFRPLIGMDKQEVVLLSKKIDTYETSILPYEDCCTVFVSKHPDTKPKLEQILKEEEKLINLDDLIREAVENTQLVEI